MQDDFIVGIGGSATNDGGIGMLQALGYGFHNKNGMPVLFGANGLKELKSITDGGVYSGTYQRMYVSYRMRCK